MPEATSVRQSATWSASCRTMYAVVNMMDEVVMVRGDEIVGTLPVAARGKLR